MSGVAMRGPFAMLLQHYRVAAGISQEELAERAGMSRRGISDLERGLRSRPYPATVRRLAEALRLSESERTALLMAANRLAVGVDAAAPESVRAALPVPLTSFVGRASELAELRQLLHTTRLLTLVGPGGIGKTRLAGALAQALSADHGPACTFVDLASLIDPMLVTPTVAWAFSAAEHPGRSQMATLLESIGSRETLLVLDNCEHLVQACATLADTLLRACPTLRIVATSREPLRIAGETVWRLRALAVPELQAQPRAGPVALSEAGQLFLERARAARPSFGLIEQNAAAVADVCRRLDGIPLALELAAVRVGVLDPAEIRARLDNCLGLLTGGGRTTLPRHQTVRATLDWSFSLLDKAERVVFRRLAVFAGGWSLEAAEAVCAGGGIEPSMVLDLLTGLVDKSLVMAEPRSGGRSRFQLLDTVRQYAGEQLEAAGAERDEAKHRHTKFFRALAEQGEPALLGPDQVVWVERLEAEHDNLRGVLRRGAGEDGLGVAGALWQFWILGGHVREGYDTLRTLLAAAPVPSAQKVRALWAGGYLAFHLGVTGACEASWWEEGLADARAMGEATMLPRLLAGVGSQEVMRGRTGDAEALLAESLAAAFAQGDDWAAAAATFWLGIAAWSRREYAQAAQHLEAALENSRRVGDKHFVARVLLMLGYVSLLNGDWDRAAELARAGLLERRGLGDPWAVAVCLGNLARVATVRERAARAARLFGAEEALMERFGGRLVLPWEAEWEVGRAGAVEATQRPLGTAAFAAEWAHGRVLDLEEAVEYGIAVD